MASVKSQLDRSPNGRPALEKTSIRVNKTGEVFYASVCGVITRYKLGHRSSIGTCGLLSFVTVVVIIELQLERVYFIGRNVTTCLSIILKCILSLKIT